MGQYDKDRFQKELALRYCLARGAIPFLEVAVRSSSDLSETVELLTDLDVVGIEAVGDGGLRRTFFDCKTANKTSPVNRALWAAGVKQYTGCDDALLILKSRAVHNHRISALSIGVDLHDELSFKDLGRTVDPAFPADDCYQASIDRWNSLHECYAKTPWSGELFEVTRNLTPLTRKPAATFRRILAELRVVSGHVDPAKPAHLAIFYDVLASSLLLWAAMGRDIRRFYEPSMDKATFESVLSYYLWGGKESYQIRQQMREKSGAEKGHTAIELPAWASLVAFAGTIISAPQNIFECAHVSRELSLRDASSHEARFDAKLSQRLKSNSRIRQFSAGLIDYLVAAGGLPKDLSKQAQGALFDA